MGGWYRARELSGIVDGKDTRLQGKLVLQNCLTCQLQNVNALCAQSFSCLCVGGGVCAVRPASASTPMC